MSSVRATVVIVNYNGAHLLPACLDGVQRQDLPASDFRTVVVDNASSDGSVELLARDYPWVQVISSPRNTGFAGGNNLALRHVDTPFAVLLNNDATPEPDWLRNLLAAFDDDQLGAVSGKTVFTPRFIALKIETPGFTPGPYDSRQLGVRVYGIEVDGVDVTDKVLWENLGYGPEDSDRGRFRWTRPSGSLLIPVQSVPGDLVDAVKITFRVSAETEKSLEIGAADATASTMVGTTISETVLAIPEGTELVDVINNAGGIVLTNGYGADRGFQRIDDGTYDQRVEVFTACGNGLAIRTAAGQEVGWFDDDFFMYYEDTDLCWRLRSRGWRIGYEPSAVLRHIHSASSKEWSPRWVFHVDRNRLLMLTKDATAALTLRAVLHYPASALSMFLRAMAAAAATRRRPALRPHLLRARVMMSYVRLLGPMLLRRRTVRRQATVSRKELERWLAQSR